MIWLDYPTILCKRQHQPILQVRKLSPPTGKQSNRWHRVGEWLRQESLCPKRAQNAKAPPDHTGTDPADTSHHHHAFHLSSSLETTGHRGASQKQLWVAPPLHGGHMRQALLNRAITNEETKKRPRGITHKLWRWTVRVLAACNEHAPL